ncbi:MAG: hypothetical protein MK488_12515 [SAR324 cluster bacterium]|nr:hypothetical protein [SAR324 cluster bacterium]
MQSVFEQDLERLVKQYDQPGPRYTSYPTVLVWPQGSFGRICRSIGGRRNQGSGDFNVSSHSVLPNALHLLRMQQSHHP